MALAAFHMEITIHIWLQGKTRGISTKFKFHDCDIYR
jgi:hypothetical protein